MPFLQEIIFREKKGYYIFYCWNIGRSLKHRMIQIPRDIPISDPSSWVPLYRRTYLIHKAVLKKRRQVREKYEGRRKTIGVGMNNINAMKIVIENYTAFFLSGLSFFWFSPRKMIMKSWIIPHFLNWKKSSSFLFKSPSPQNFILQ